MVAFAACDEAGRLPLGYAVTEDTRHVEADDGEADTSSRIGVDATASAQDSSGLTDAATDAEAPDAAEDGHADATPDLGPGDVRPADAEVDAPRDPSLTYPSIGSEPGRLTLLAPGDITWVASPDASRTLIVRDGELLSLTRSGAISFGPSPDPRAVVTLPDGRLLLATRTEVLVEDAGRFVTSPLTTALDAPVVGLASDPDSLWISTEAALHQVADLTLRKVVIPGFNLGSPRLALGPSPTVGTALWVGSPDGVIALAPSGPTFSAWLTAPLSPDALAVDASGRVWVLADGRVHRRAPDNVWTAFGLDETPHDLLAHPTSRHVWLIAPDTTLHESNGNWARLDTRLPSANAYAITPDGTLLLATSTGLLALPPGRLISLSGLAPGALLEAPTPIEVRVSDPDLALIDARLDGLPVATELDGEGPARSFRLTLDPALLRRGPHRLSVEVRYTDDTTRLEAALPFEVMYATWTDDVAPIYATRCATCHNAVAGASTAVLNTSHAWRERIDCILCRVSLPVDSTSPECRACGDFASPMPPAGPLSDQAVEQLRRWRTDGFREE
jgi:hypothetical protein